MWTRIRVALTIEECPQVKEKDGGDTTAVERASLGSVCSVGDLDVSTDEPHAETSADRAVHEQLTTAQLIN